MNIGNPTVQAKQRTRRNQTTSKLEALKPGLALFCLLPWLQKTRELAPYTVFMPKKTQKMVYSKGKPVYELVDPDGKIYILQARKEWVPMESLATLGQQMKHLPTGGTMNGGGNHAIFRLSYDFCPSYITAFTFPPLSMMSSLRKGTKENNHV